MVHYVLYNIVGVACVRHDIGDNGLKCGLQLKPPGTGHIAVAGPYLKRMNEL